MERHGGKEVMSKKEIIEKIVATTGCSEEKAKMIFDKARTVSSDLLRDIQKPPKVEAGTGGSER